uniref:Uncharacterized protein n=2 Tax=Avena sativa TaxID=4498 RepID=A0ACD5VC45_AVESA
MVLEAAVVVSLVGWLVTPVISKSVDAALKYIEENKKSLKNVNPKLQELAGQLSGINKVVHKVRLCFNKTGTGEAVEHLWRLKGAIDEAEEILDLFEYDSLKNKASSSEFTGTKNSPSRLEKVVEKLGKLLESAGDFIKNWENIIGVYPISYGGRETGWSPENVKNFFHGYQEEHGKLEDLLRGEQNKVIAIIGHGGMGKTHLARKVFNANESKFDVRIWAHVCNELDETSLLENICVSAIGMSGELIHVPMDSRARPLTALETKLKGLSEPSGWFDKPVNRCLVVLDDVWQREDGFWSSQTEGDEAWKRVLAKLIGLKMCKVVMTTRAKIRSTTVAVESIVLNGISEAEMTELLKDIAKPDRLPRGLARRIGKLMGSPRAALSVVENLKQRAGENEKQIILDELNEDHHIEGVYEDHLFTYRHLPLHLQSCLAFCSMFPYNWRFEPDKLTRMWIAHGFIDDTKVMNKQPHQKLTIEDVAAGYFKDLVDRCLLFKRLAADGLYEIHVHIHSMLRRVSCNDCMSISNGSSSEMTIPATVRHLSVTASCLTKLKPGPSLQKSNQVKSNNKKKSDDEFRTVRTLLVFTDKEAPSSSSSPWRDIREANSTLRKFKGVKVLDLTDTYITQLPDSIGELIHLRYLGFPNTVKQPPAQVTKLLLLETFYISNPRLAKQSPADTKYGLIRRQRLDMDMECIARISGIGKLQKLQGSLEFHIHRKNCKEGHSMSELGKMNSLSRTLSIKGIQNVKTKEEAQMAELESKASLQVLKLDWELNQDQDAGRGKGKSSPTAVSVLEGLQPHANLRELHITRYPGEKLPIWMWDLHQMKNLTSVYLTSCTELMSSSVNMGQIDRLKQKFPLLKIVIDRSEVGSGAAEYTGMKPKNKLTENGARPVRASSSESTSQAPKYPGCPWGFPPEAPKPNPMGSKTSDPTPPQALKMKPAGNKTYGLTPPQAPKPKPGGNKTSGLTPPWAPKLKPAGNKTSGPTPPWACKPEPVVNKTAGSTPPEAPKLKPVGNKTSGTTTPTWATIRPGPGAARAGRPPRAPEIEGPQIQPRTGPGNHAKAHGQQALWHDDSTLGNHAEARGQQDLWHDDSTLGNHAEARGQQDVWPDSTPGTQAEARGQEDLWPDSTLGTQAEARGQQDVWPDSTRGTQDEARGQQVPLAPYRGPHPTPHLQINSNRRLISRDHGILWESILQSEVYLVLLVDVYSFSLWFWRGAP